MCRRVRWVYTYVDIASLTSLEILHRTKNLAFGVTASVSYEAPYSLARRFSTLDHLTKGRIAFNIVTGYITRFIIA